MDNKQTTIEQPPALSVLAVMAEDSIAAFNERDRAGGASKAFEADDRGIAAREAVAELLRSGQALVANTFDEAADAAAAGHRVIWCQADALNPCWDASRGLPDRIPVRHWGGGAACPDCAFRAALARCGGAGMNAPRIVPVLAELHRQGVSEAVVFAARELMRAARMPNAAVIADPETGAPLRVEVPPEEWAEFRAAWRAAGGTP